MTLDAKTLTIVAENVAEYATDHRIDLDAITGLNQLATEFPMHRPHAESFLYDLAPDELSAVLRTAAIIQNL